ncbi:MAG: hypothetical protein RL417_1055 [Pseudomonadota bacterium]|jgi:uncharacterized protein (TIRG00374 family)
MTRILLHRWTQRIIAAVLVGALIFSVNIHELLGALSRLTVPLAVYLLYISGVLIYLSALKWKLFLESFGRSVSLVRLNALYYIGYFVNLLLPSHLGGDAVRSWYLGKSIGQHEAFAATILERLLGLVAMLGLGLVSMWFVPAASWEVRGAIVAMAIGLAVAIGVILSRRCLELAQRLPRMERLVGHLHKVQGVLRAAASNRPVLLKALGLSLVFHSLTVVNTVAAAAAVGWYGVPYGELFVVLPIILLIGSLPITPSGLGLQEGAFLYFLTGLGATPAEALGVGVILRLKSYLLALVGGIVWWRVRREGPQLGSSSGEAALAD